MPVALADLLPSIGVGAGFGGLGAVMGYAVKKLLKLLTVVIGIILALFFAPVAYLSYKGIITVDWTALYVLLTNTGTWILQAASSVIQSVSLAVPAVGCLTAGFALGFTHG